MNLSDMSIYQEVGTEPLTLHVTNGNMTADHSGCVLTNGVLSATISVSSAVDIEYSYDNNGLRAQKKVTQNGVSTYTNYILNGKHLAAVIQGTDKLYFFYDAQSRPAFMSYDSKDYMFVQNLQGDVVAILDGSGNKVVEYAYDAWGRHTKTQTYAMGSTTPATATKLASLNPFRYRGYVYDDETKLYYLRARYYNPEWGRFINEDSVIGKTGALLSHNMFAYCNNQPIRFCDPSGQTWLDTLKSIVNRPMDGPGTHLGLHWLFGNGKDLIFNHDSRWDKYMMDNSRLTNQVRKIVTGLTADLKRGETMVIRKSMPMVMDNGEDIIGYQYLHGTNNKAGDFVISGKISRDNNGKATYDLTYQWNDIIDPNYKYTTDQEKSNFAHNLPFVAPKDYRVEIIWSDVSTQGNDGLFISGWFSNY